MAREFSRTDRVADAIQREIAILIHDEVRDPRVGMVNITDVALSRDLSVARVYLTFVDKHEPADVKSAIAALNGAAGFLRHQLSHSIRLRTTPRLLFLHDETGTRGAHLAALIDYAVASDRSHEPDTDKNGES